jgi:hypothetical protein
MTNNDIDVYSAVLAHDSYSKDGVDFSVTELLRPPQTTHLKHRFSPRDLDPYQNHRSFIGTAIHDYLEAQGRKLFPDAIFERRFRKDYEVDGETYSVGGKADVVFPGQSLQDYKVILTAGCPSQVKPDHYEQVQMNAALASHEGITVPFGQVTYILDDWRWRPKQWDKRYPKEPIAKFIFPIEPPEHVESRFLQRLKEHVAAKNGETRPCTDEERWKHPDKWMVGKPQNKRPRKGHLSEAEAKADLKKGEKILEHRPGVYKRCEEWCEFSHVCPQFNSNQRTP